MVKLTNASTRTVLMQLQPRAADQSYRVTAWRAEDGSEIPAAAGVVPTAAFGGAGGATLRAWVVDGSAEDVRLPLDVVTYAGACQCCAIVCAIMQRFGHREHR